MDEKYPKWVSRVFIEISTQEGSNQRLSQVGVAESTTIRLVNVRSITRSGNAPKEIVDDIYNPNAGIADQPHRQRIRLSISSVAENSDLLEKLMEKNMYFKMTIRDENESWKFTPVTYEWCKVESMSEDIDYSNFPYITYEIVALKKTVSGIVSDLVPEEQEE